MGANFSIWGTMGNQAYSMPMNALTPPDPINNGYALYWNTLAQALDYAPLNFNPVTGDALLTANLGIAANKTFSVNGTPVVGTRNTGWPSSSMYAAGVKYAIDPNSATLTQVANTLNALVTALTTHGLIGA